MDYLPLFHRLQGRTCLLVGGGVIALRKARLLVSAGASVRLVSPSVLDELTQLIQNHGGEIINDVYQSHYLKDCVLVVCATDDAAVNEQVSADCFAINLPVNVVDSPALCSVITPP